MSRFQRRESPPQFDDHAQYKPFLRRDFRYLCAYCERSEVTVGGDEFFEVDHFRPVKHFPHLRTSYPNLYWVCGPCNRRKGSSWPSRPLVDSGYRFSDPCQEDLYREHVEERPDGALNPITYPGIYTCEHIRLNRPALTEWRRERRKMARALARKEWKS